MYLPKLRVCQYSVEYDISYCISKWIVFYLAKVKLRTWKYSSLSLNLGTHFKVKMSFYMEKLWLHQLICQGCGTGYMLIFWNCIFTTFVWSFNFVAYSSQHLGRWWERLAGIFNRSWDPKSQYRIGWNRHDMVSTT